MIPSPSSAVIALEVVSSILQIYHEGALTCLNNEEASEEPGCIACEKLVVTIEMSTGWRGGTFPPTSIAELQKDQLLAIDVRHLMQHI